MKNLVLHNRNSLQSDFDRLFDSVFGLANTNYSRTVAVDVREANDKFILEAELPGYDEKDVNIRVEDNLLVIESMRSTEQNSEQDGWVIRERMGFNFRRSFALPKEVNVDAIDASFKNGILTVEIPKTEKAKPRTIEIKKI